MSEFLKKGIDFFNAFLFVRGNARREK